MAISSNLTLELLNQPFLLEKRIELLKAIKQTGSINKAAAIVPMSYKTAWEAVEAMNNLSISPIVTKETGGAGGGGEKLIPIKHEYSTGPGSQQPRFEASMEPVPTTFSSYKCTKYTLNEVVRSF